MDYIEKHFTKFLFYMLLFNLFCYWNGILDYTKKPNNIDLGFTIWHGLMIIIFIFFLFNTLMDKQES